jgi:hypothetical protein
VSRVLAVGCLLCEVSVVPGEGFGVIDQLRKNRQTLPCAPGVVQSLLRFIAFNVRLRKVIVDDQTHPLLLNQASSVHNFE